MEAVERICLERVAITFPGTTYPHAALYATTLRPEIF